MSTNRNPNISCEGDSQRVIKMIENFEPDDSHSGILIEDVIFLLAQFLGLGDFLGS